MKTPARVAPTKPSGNVRNTPAKTRPPGKFFTTSPKERHRNKALSSKTTNKKGVEVEDTAWFDSDTLFGFGPED